MQRDIGNEVIVAIVVVSVLAFALTFGIILSLSNSNAGTSAQSNVATDGPTETPDPTATATETPTAASTATDAATATREPTATNTATDAPTATATVTDAPAATDEPTVTRTPTLTRTPQPSATEAATSTNTPTKTLTHTPQPTATATTTLTRTPTLTRTSTATPTASPTPENVCIAPFGWVVYQVQHGDTLPAVARATGSTVDALRTANCLVSVDQIQTGDRLYVPGVPNFDPPAAGLEVQGCTDANIQITRPLPGQRVRGSFILVGTAAQDNFSYYQIEIRPDSSNIFNFYSRSVNPVVDGVLGTVELRGYQNGLHWVRLSIVDDSGRVNTRPCAIPLIFE